MALYITSADFKTYAGITTASTTHNATITASITAASRAVDGWCGRTFTQNTSSTESRAYPAKFTTRLELDDFSTTTGLVVETDDADSGSYGTTWTITTDFVVEPANLLLNGIPWAYTTIRAVGSRRFYCGPRPRVQVTAAFGWPAVPDAVTQATYQLALDIFKMKDAPFGVAGFNEYGQIRVRENNTVKMLLQPYRKHGLVL